MSLGPTSMFQYKQDWAEEGVELNTITVGLLELRGPFRIIPIPSFYSIICQSLHEGWSRAPTLPASGGRRAPVLDGGPVTPATLTLTEYQQSGNGKKCTSIRAQDPSELVHMCFLILGKSQGSLAIPSLSQNQDVDCISGIHRCCTLKSPERFLNITQLWFPPHIN